MQTSGFTVRAGLVLTALSCIGLTSCASVRSKVASAISPDKSREAPPSLLGKRSTDGPSRPAPGSTVAATPAPEKESPINDETRTHVALAMGEMLEGAGKLADAAENYDWALKLDPKSLKAALALARVYNRMGRPDAAIKVYEAAEKQHRKEPALHNDKALLLAEQHDLSGAIAALRQAIKLEPSNSKYHNNLGMVLAMSGEYDEAWKEFREAVGPGPAHYNVATMLMKAGHTNEARDHLERAVAIMPSLKEAQTILAQIDAPRSVSPRESSHDAAAEQAELDVVTTPTVTIRSIRPEKSDEEIVPTSASVPAHEDPWAKPHVPPKWLR